MIAATENNQLIPAQIEAEFSVLLGKTFASEPQWLKQKRENAYTSFLKKGIPSGKNEEYRYSDTSRIFRQNFTCLQNNVHALPVDYEKIFVAHNSIKLILINGRLPKDSTLATKLPKGVIVGSMANDALFLHREILQKYWSSVSCNSNDSFAHLNTAFWLDGAFVFFPENTTLEQPVEIVHISTGRDALLVNTRHLIIAGKNTAANIIEHNISLLAEKAIITNTATEIFAEENAKVNFCKIQHSHFNGFHFSNIFAQLKKNSVLESCTVTLGSNWTRNNLYALLDEEYGSAHLNGLFLTDGSGHCDSHTLINHCKPNCESYQLYRGILNGKSTGIFNGKILVHPGAQKTNAYQSSKNVLLSDDAAAHTMPQLEIYADDVKCSHGSSTGKIDENALFYLRSRGLSESGARKLLLHAFASDVLTTIPMDALRHYLENLIEKQL